MIATSPDTVTARSADASTAAGPAADSTASSPYGQAREHPPQRGRYRASARAEALRQAGSDRAPVRRRGGGVGARARRPASGGSVLPGCWRRGLHPQGHRRAAQARARQPSRSAVLPLPGRVAGGHGGARGGQDPREHGDRPQRHARPVGLDARSQDPLQPRGSGTTPRRPVLWKRSHNEVHHTYTNVLGRDNDLGYGIMRVDEDQRWVPICLGQPLWNLVTACIFEYGIAAYDIGAGQAAEGPRGQGAVPARRQDRCSARSGGRCARTTWSIRCCRGPRSSTPSGRTPPPT